MRITIRSLRDDPFFIEVDEQDTIFGVKTVIFQMNGVFPSHQSIIYQGNILANDIKLLSLNFPVNKQPSLYLVISKEQRERLKREKEEKSKQSSNSFDLPPKSDLFSSFSSSLSQGFSAQNNTCFDSIMKNITDKSPNFSHALNDKEALYESYDAFRDPGKRLELLKSIDRTLNLVESKAGCYRDIIQHQKLVSEAVDDAIDKYMHEINPSYYENMHKTVIPEKPLEEPSCEPIKMDLSQSDSFMDSLLQRQLMLVMTLPNGTQKLVTVKKNADTVLKIMQLMMNLQAKTQKDKSKFVSHSQNKDNNQYFNNVFHSNFVSKDQPSPFEYDCDQENLFAKRHHNEMNENENSNIGLDLKNGLKQLELENQMNLLKFLMMSIVSDENKNDQNTENEKKSCSFFNIKSKKDKKSDHSSDDYDSESNENNQSMFSSWSKLFCNNKLPKLRRKNKFAKQPKYEQIFHHSNKKKPAPPADPFLVDFDSDSDTNSDSNFSMNSNSCNSNFQPLTDEDCFFNDEYFMKNNIPFSPDTKEYIQPRIFSQRNTTYYSPTSESIQKAKREESEKKSKFSFNFLNKDNKISSDYNNCNDENNNADEIEKKRQKGWKIIYDIANNSNKNADFDDQNHESKDSFEENDNDYQNNFSNLNNDDDSSDISID